jgi:hypothetical protein
MQPATARRRIPEQLDAGQVQHFGWGAGPEQTEAFNRSLAAHASP